MVKKSFPSIRITERIDSLVRKALKKYNKEHFFETTLADFRRMAYLLLSTYIIENKLKDIELED